MVIRFASKRDIERLDKYDKHIAKNELESVVKQNRVIIIEEEKSLVGWLRYNLFWDNTPFMNMLFILDGYRGKGLGKKLVSYWESKMKELQYDFVMTSTQSDENAQHFYRKLSYIDAGSLLLPNEPLEIIFIKNLKDGGLK